MIRRCLIFLLISITILCFSGKEMVAEEAGFIVYYHDNAQVELIDSGQNRVLIDVYGSNLLSAKETSKDVLLTTHYHPDHLDSMYVNNFPGQKLIGAGEIQSGPIKIRGIAASHFPAFSPGQPSNFIYIIEIAGFRVVHFGDCGQTQFTPEQLAQIGKVDLAFAQFSNPYSQMNMENKNGFKLMDQVKPRLIIPTHISQSDAVEETTRIWPAFYSDQNKITISRTVFGSGTQILYLGRNARENSTLFKMQKWDK